METCILGIESSCDDTSAAVICNGKLYSNIINTQSIHFKYGGVVPELASRAHQQNIVLVVKEALEQAGKNIDQISAIAFTQGPGLLGSLLVGSSFAKGLAIAQDIPIIGINHLQGHIFAPFLREKDEDEFIPNFPFLCLLVSGGHTQLIIVKSYTTFEIIGSTIDDAAGEAFDKCAKVMNLGYPGGPLIDKYAKLGNPNKFQFSKPKIAGLNFSFSGLKTSFLYFLRDQIKDNKNFISDNLSDLCASIQSQIVDILLDKLLKAVKQTGIKNIAISGGVSANSCLRNKLTDLGLNNSWNLYIPKIKYTTDNAAMITLVAYHYFMEGRTDSLDIVSIAKLSSFS
ncbi:MAG: tRNA (adenosine(37)-N6)-threonylcarbamoyltransferase complex transferase subunit TsaD [Bacteroidales bacterium]|jgi:N6-L-threonylcarbamoyladenine synthase|nr:tRNA (adenosine(37)-N6)-threonylcarbamoyltransferase complex transferase subunit TsaD [Bacteroidales bacterium]MCK9500164.1 tRNA (adenosine(37)-N6)-threonylcarbamoyltransferase complex transferase subunit TsaD [Bacteroidales bacterium]MDY0315144.1 tRNA (adenosine(37)-N6)-threonylcarbamoyltransferase complex transferase subunit TsaD [Bacteroidales bacterium]NLB87398.1 tRNA (adenosine(37)-N6)-threonylcarbamoyltransferase complex transferase subunit TsaD [Bacteroidales bacterium]